MKRKKDKQIVEPKIIRTLSIDEIDKLTKKIGLFMFSLEEHRIIQDSIQVDVYDNGDIIINGDFETHYNEKF